MVHIFYECPPKPFTTSTHFIRSNQGSPTVDYSPLAIVNHSGKHNLIPKDTKRVQEEVLVKNPHQQLLQKRSPIHNTRLLKVAITKAKNPEGIVLKMSRSRRRRDYREVIRQINIFLFQENLYYNCSDIPFLLLDYIY